MNFIRKTIMTFIEDTNVGNVVTLKGIMKGLSSWMAKTVMPKLNRCSCRSKGGLRGEWFWRESVHIIFIQSLQKYLPRAYILHLKMPRKEFNGDFISTTQLIDGY